MNKNTPTFRPPKQAFPRAAFSVRVVLHASVLFVVALFPCATPSFGLLNVTECEAPVDQDESSEEVAIGVQTRPRVVRNQPNFWLLVPVCGDFSLDIVRPTSVPRSGHRLSNDLLAPLRC